MSNKEVKNIFTFDVFVPKTVSEDEVSQDNEGNEVITRKKTEKQVPVKVTIREPNRRDIESGNNFYAKECNRYMRDGFMTRKQVEKLYADQGGAFSETFIKDSQTRIGELPNMEKEAATLEAEAKKFEESGDKEQSTEPAAKAKTIRDKMKKLEEEFTNIQSTMNSLYEFTSETQALNALIKWFILHLTYFTENGVEKPMFAGKDYKEKQESEYKLSDDKDLVYSLSHSKLAGVISYWYFRNSVTEKELQDICLKIEKNEY
jgi:hypothetical protein